MVCSESYNPKYYHGIMSNIYASLHRVENYKDQCQYQLKPVSQFHLHRPQLPADNRSTPARDS